MGEYATKEKGRAKAAALKLFAFDPKSREVVTDEYQNPSSIDIKLIQYAYLT
jgi:hypothetical protein